MVKTRETLDPNRSLWEWMAVDLRFYRLKHGETLARVGQIIGCTRSTVSNLEAARPGFKLSDKQAERLDEHWDLNGHFALLLRYARAGHDPDWFRTATEYERRARILRLYEALVIPGLLQIPEYATAFLRAGRVRDIEAKLAARMARQEILTRDDPPEMQVLLYQAALLCPIGGAEVMKDQLARLLEVSELSHVTLRVVPFAAGAHMGLDGSFQVFGVREGEVAYAEANGGGRLILDVEEVRSYAIRFDRIGAEALSRAASQSLIMEVMETPT
jgi:hypothetical protein